jgi:ketosteroid isomerase-like protein
MRVRFLKAFVLLIISAWLLPPSEAQLLDPMAHSQQPNPLSDPTTNPGQVFLFELEAKFAHATKEGGGKAFAAFFAPDGVTLANGKAPVIGSEAIAAQATWSPQEYQLTWTPEGGQMNASGDMGFTWGHYEGRSKDRAGNSIVANGRYMTIWKKQSDGSWKVVLDSSNDEPPAAGDCCKLP